LILVYILVILRADLIRVQKIFIVISKAKNSNFYNRSFLGKALFFESNLFRFLNGKSYEFHNCSFYGNAVQLLESVKLSHQL
jgi:hypothetical protein